MSGSRKLSDDRIMEVYRQVLDFLSSQESITNRELRKLTGLTYDQAIYFFNHMVDCGHLIRVGRSSSTRYVLPRD